MYKRIVIESIKGNKEIKVDTFITLKGVEKPISILEIDEDRTELEKIKSDIEKLILDYLANKK